MLGLAPVQHAMADQMTEVAIGYPNSPLNGPALKDGPKPGERIVPVAGQAPIGSGDTPRFALFAERSAVVADLVARFATLLDPEIRPAFGSGGIWLVRPDGYVACAANDAVAVAGYLADLTR
jgi:hypothetical protein